jgi:hypothetical protein
VRRRASLVAACLVVLPLLVGCRSDENAYIPPGTYAGSTSSDQAFTLDIGDKVHVNKVEGRFVKRGVIEIKGPNFKAKLTCKVTDKKGEELRCALDFPGNGTFKPATEVIDLMLL